MQSGKILTIQAHSRRYNLNSPVSTKETEFIVNIFPQKKTSLKNSMKHLRKNQFYTHSSRKLIEN